jgi:predicted nuclease of restriction endonuclease-like RecB superfamily
LNLDKAGVKLQDVPARIVWFKDKLLPKSILGVIEE